MNGHILGAVNQKKLYSGSIFMVIGIVAFIWAQEYAIGTATQMGPGYFPAMLGILLIVLGAGAVIGAIGAKEPDPIEARSLVPLLLILLSIVSFGWTIDRLGLLPAIFLAVFFACMHRLRSRPLEVFLIFAALASFCSTVFVYLFSMPVPLFRWSF